jgi:hypothetical protein
MLGRSNLLIVFGVHARWSEPSRDGVKKLWASNKGIVKSVRKETIARIENSDQRGLMDRDG